MMSYHINLLGKFGTSSVIMPYYGETHKSFLLLSQLDRQSRDMLDGNFDAVLNWMMWNLTCLNIDGYNKEMLLMPWNLFKFSFNLVEESMLNVFIRLIERIKNKEGYYFNANFMHSRLWIDQIKIDTKFVNKLSPIIDLLKIIEVTDYIKQIILK